MASPVGPTDPSLKGLLFERSYEFNFFQAVRLLERLPFGKAGGGVGTDTLPAEEGIRFHAHQSMAFPPSQIHEIREANPEKGRVDMTVAFMGLTGPVGVLPWHYTELLIELKSYKNTALEEFFDLFNHRMISLFYRAWEKHRFFISYEKTPSATKETGLTKLLFDLIGLGTPGLRERFSIPDHAMLRYAGLIAQRPHSASAMQGILSDYFSVPVQVHSFQGQWFKLDNEDQSCLGERHNHLGKDCFAGDSVWNPQARIGIDVGPVSSEKFAEFLPEGSAFRGLRDWVQFFIGMAIEFELRLVLDSTAVPECHLSDEVSEGSRLGWTSWLKTEEFTEDAGDAVFSGEERVLSA